MGNNIPKPITSSDLYDEAIDAIAEKSYELALEKLNDAIKLEDTNSEFFNARGYVQKCLGHFPKAYFDYKKAINLCPKFEYLSNYSNVCVELELFEEALKSNTEAIKLQPENETLYFNRALSYQKLEKWQESQQDLDTAISLNPQYAKAYNERAILHSKFEKYETALNDHTVAIKLNDKNSVYYYNRAATNHRMGHISLALNDIRRAYKLDSENEIYKKALDKLAIESDEKSLKASHRKSLPADSSEYRRLAFLNNNTDKNNNTKQKRGRSFSAIPHKK